MFEEVETSKVEQEKRCGNIPAKNEKSDTCVLRYGRGKASFEKRKTHKKWQMRQLQ